MFFAKRVKMPLCRTSRSIERVVIQLLAALTTALDGDEW
jgi:hypothetical protein